ncbi:DUF488 domain-containing protein [Treponema sp. OMZ 857]|uniref:DUF488 domain-containing protein n=1 Tax=Treponema sp. OMZ 857 TaxID=1643513 RepID=UPI0020A36190|nr:DUF488 family protein [Treponema sp. OMZ 857]UTC43620.1 DUF488 family protein [Treponema sp. OMZ 857]
MGTLYWKRIYDTAEPQDGFRILADRLWPRGITKEKAMLGDWAKDITPSSDIRQAYHRGDMDYSHFSALYAKELAENPTVPAFIEKIKSKLQTGNVTILYAVREPETSHIPTLRAFIEKHLKQFC